MKKLKMKILWLTCIFVGLASVNEVYASQIPSYIEEQLTPELYASAEITMPEQFKDDCAEIVNIKRKKFDIEEVEPLLWEDKITSEKLSDSDFEEADLGKYTVTTFYGEDGSILDVGGTQIIYDTPLYDALCNAVYTNPLTSSYNLDKYRKDNLDFLNINECVEEVKALFHKLGVVVSEDYFECYALDAKTLKEEEVYLDIDGNRQKDKEKGTWMSEDECYYLRFFQEYNEVSVYDEGYGDYLNGNGYPKSNIEVIYGKEGVVHLNINNIYETIDGTQGEEQIISIEDLKTLLKDKYELLIRNGVDKITGVRMEYLPCDAGDGISMFVPAWILKVETPVEGMDNYITTLLFNAVTGKELY